MAEFKTAQDLEASARWLVQQVSNRLEVSLTSDRRVKINITEETTRWLASELLHVYTEGVNDWLEKN